MITYRKLQDTIVGTIDGKPFNLPRTEDTEQFLKDATAENSKIDSTKIWDYIKACRNTTIAQSNKYLAFNPITKEYFLELDGKRSAKAVPQSLVDYIEESYDKEIDFMPIVKAWARLLSNPRYTDQHGKYFENYISTMFVDQDEKTRLIEEEDVDPKLAENMATYQDVAITQEGLMATYKVAEEVTWQYEMVEQEDGRFLKVKSDRHPRIAAVIDDVTGEVITPETFTKPEYKEEMIFTPAICKSGDKFFSGDKIGYVYEIGKMQYLPEGAKRNLNHTSCGGGLYIGGLNYVDGFRNCGTHVLTCFVDPADIISFQSDGHAIRVDALMPYNVWDEDIPMKGVYHSSEYGKTSTERIEAIIQNAIDKDIDLVEYQKNALGDEVAEDDNLSF